MALLNGVEADHPEIDRRIAPTARSARAAIVSVGFEAAPVGNTPLPTR
jgi:hypothetical protein